MKILRINKHNDDIKNLVEIENRTIKFSISILGNRILDIWGNI